MKAGDSIGPYRVVSELGAGGMGEVWRATDSRLRRDVAIKVLPAAFLDDEARLARFEREAQLLAQLQHPNIASIYGLEESGGALALVMEVVEGPTLAERLEQGALPLPEGLAIARQIADALEVAHEKGIVHRDLKPQNVKASPEGKVKILDFGLAKAMDLAAGAGPGSPSQIAASPTTLGATVQGVILSDRRTHAPYGLHGGAPGARGRNVLGTPQADGTRREQELPGKANVQVGAGASIRIETPGGGGWGAPLRDNRKAGRYELPVGEQVAFLDYRRAGDLVVLAHVETPAALRGRGLAGIMTRHALEATRAEGLRVDPQCPFVRDYIRKHPGLEELVATPPRKPGDRPRT